MTPFRLAELGVLGFATNFAAQGIESGFRIDPSVIIASTISAVGFIIVGLIARSSAKESRKANEAAGIAAARAGTAAEKAGEAATVADNAAAASAKKLDANAGRLEEVHTLVDGRLTAALESIEQMAQRIEDLGGRRMKTHGVRPKSKRRGS